MCSEAVVWANICLSTHGLCSPDFEALVQTGTLLGDPFSGHGSAVLLTAIGGVRSLRDPQSMRGATEGEFLDLAKASGLKVDPMTPTAATGGRGWRAYSPGDKSVNVFWEVGDPKSNASDIVHQGPYFKWQVKGSADGFRVPGAGNPNPNSGWAGSIPKVITEWGGVPSVIEEAPPVE
jgi:hypothetical protein